MFNSYHNSILLPIVSLVAWTMVMWFWMYLTRLPAIFKSKMKLDPSAPRGEQMNTLPASVRWKADNYNHLMEEPTLFYALALVLFIVGEGYGANNLLAWVYVLLRIIHSLFQALINKIEVRFVLFVLSSITLIIMIFNALKSLTAQL